MEWVRQLAHHDLPGSSQTQFLPSNKELSEDAVGNSQDDISALVNKVIKPTTFFDAFSIQTITMGCKRKYILFMEIK
jgi:hypothetical protein